MTVHLSQRAIPAVDRCSVAYSEAAAIAVALVSDRCDVYVQPYAGDQNAGYILVGLDNAPPTVIATMRAHGHDLCVVLQTNPGHQQAWIRLSTAPLEPTVATAAGKLLAATEHSMCSGGR